MTEVERVQIVEVTKIIKQKKHINYFGRLQEASHGKMRDCLSRLTRFKDDLVNEELARQTRIKNIER